jgi:HEAT repeat protein
MRLLTHARYRRLICATAVATIALPVAAQSRDAERQFREWANERVQVLARSRDPAKRLDAAEYLGGFTDADVIAALDAALDDSDARVRAAAAGSLWESGKASEPARAHLVRAMNDPAVSVAIRAAGALEMLGVPDAELVPARRRVFESPGVSNVDQYMAARGLIGHMSPSALLPPILEFLERAAAPRPASARSIAQRESLEGAVAALQRLAKTGDRSLIEPMQAAARTAQHSQPDLLDALAIFSPKDDSWTSFLVGFLQSRNAKVRHASLALLGRELREKDVALWAPRAAELFSGHDGLDELIASGYRLPPGKVKLYETTYAQKPAVLALVRKAAR